MKLTEIEFPDTFYEFLVQETDPDLLFGETINFPELQSAVFEGFSLSRKKMRRIISQPKVQSKLKYAAKHSREVLALLLRLWGKKNRAIIDFFQALTPEFIAEHSIPLRKVLGPNSLFCILYNLENCKKETIFLKADSDFWNEESPGLTGMFDPTPFIAAAEIFKNYTRGSNVESPLASSTQTKSSIADNSSKDRNVIKKLERKLKRQQDIIKKLEKRVEKLNSRYEKATVSISKCRTEIERYKKELDQQAKKLETAKKKEKRKTLDEIFARFKPDLPSKDAENTCCSLDTIFERTEKAFKLQQKADREYGRISELRAKLIKLEFYLEEISKIYSESVFIHPEIQNVKRQLEAQRQRILSLPRAETFASAPLSRSLEDHIKQKVSLLDPSANSLQILRRFNSVLTSAVDLGFELNTSALREAIEKKEKLILRFLYERFCSEIDPEGKLDIVEDLDQFTQSKAASAYDLYIDAYNILLTVNDNSPVPENVFKKAREDFIRAVVRRSASFAKVYLVFDGLSSDRERHGNVKIFFADRTRGETADEILIRLLHQRDDNRAILATADKEIIEQTVDFVFATVEPNSFYSFLFDKNLSDCIFQPNNI